jgi:hypothetical protein
LFDKLNSGVHWITGAPANSTDRASVQIRRKSTNQPPMVAKIPF